MMGEREMRRRLKVESGDEGNRVGSHDQLNGSHDQSDKTHDQSGSHSTNQSEGSHGHKEESHDQSHDTSDAEAERVFVQSGQVLESDDLQDSSDNHDEL